ncbi:methyl-accepting chemotaxis protein [Clostridium aestuarii]|uniref:Methyl-accepting chemotaxis protein n=1 Tax=Clostridium aestuarii TaxID=338193 RepID=A0ABT4D0Y9_9CLOT|nr:methyl-accepting chemotaxis protein [Clostridium aestuarii]MCY6484904.1 methyl-accepting chemotaxis protein [Clostridium aestuarii]
MKLKSKFIAMFIAFALIPITIAGVLIYFTSKNTSVKVAYKNLENQTISCKESVKNTIGFIKKSGIQVSQEKLIKDYLLINETNQQDKGKLKTVKNQFNDIMENYIILDNIELVDEKGTILVDASGKLTGLDLSEMDYFKKVKKINKPYITSPMKSFTSDVPIILTLEPVLNNDEVKGYIIQVVNLKLLADEYLSNIKIGDTGYIYVTDKDGTMIIHPKQEELMKKNLLKIDIGQKIIDTKNGTEIYRYSGTEKLISYDTDEEFGWKYIANVPVNEFMKVNKAIIHILLIIMVLSLIAAVVISVLISRNISKPIVKASENMDKIAEGDFTNKIEIKGKDEAAVMAQKLNSTLAQLRNAISGIKNSSSSVNEIAKSLASTSEEMTSASSEVATAVQEVARGASSQANNLMEVVNLFDKFNEELENIRNKIKNVNSGAENTKEKAIYGKKQIDSLMVYIKNVQTSVTKTIEKINNLSQSISKIGNITDVINKISEQTNLLALNANIEAARAGEHGKGFAVVGEEVRKLAEQTQNSSQEILELVKEVVKEMKEVQVDSNDVDVLVREQVSMANNTNVSFDNILEAVKDMEPLVKETNETVDEVIESKNVITNKIQSVSAVSEEVSASSEEIAASSEQMNASSEDVANFAVRIEEEINELVEKVNKFKVE